MTVRFETAQDLFDAFPSLENDVEAAPTGEDVLGYLRRLATSATPEDAITFTAYLLRRRDAVYWGCVALARLDLADEGSRTLATARTWVRAPSDGAQRAALEAAQAGDPTLEATWLAYAAGWSGGNISAPGDPPMVPPQYLTARAVRAALLIGIARPPIKARRAGLDACLAEGWRIIECDEPDYAAFGAPGVARDST